MSRGQSKPKLRDLTRDGPTQEDTRIILDQASSFLHSKNVPPGTDRIIAISMAAYLDHLVEERAIAFLKNKDSETLDKLMSERGPLGSFYSKIWMAFSLGAIDAATRDDLDHIRQIRNVFAHARTVVTFDTALVGKECRKLGVTRILGFSGAVAKEMNAEMTPRQYFIFSSISLSWVLLLGNLEGALATMLEKVTKDGDTTMAEQIEKAMLTAHRMGDLTREETKAKLMSRAKSTAPVSRE